MDTFQQASQESSMTARIQAIMKATKMSQQDFAKTLGISPASLSSILNNRTNPTANHVRAIHAAFPNINVSWLMFGEGDMLLPADEHAEASPDGLAAGQVDGQPSSPSAVPIEGAFDFAHDDAAERRSEQQAARLAQQEAVIAKLQEMPRREISEIRVFFDDGTFESFVPNRGSAK